MFPNRSVATLPLLLFLLLTYKFTILLFFHYSHPSPSCIGVFIVFIKMKMLRWFLTWRTKEDLIELIYLAQRPQNAGCWSFHVAGLHGICIFPVLCELNGGAAFLLCTVVLYIILGVPAVLVESGLGQLGRQSPAAFLPKLCPLLSGM